MCCRAKVMQDTFAQTITSSVNNILMREMVPGSAQNATGPWANLRKRASRLTETVTERIRVPEVVSVRSGSSRRANGSLVAVGGSKAVQHWAPGRLQITFSVTYRWVRLDRSIDKRLRAGD
jgi:hypothetical protein